VKFKFRPPSPDFPSRRNPWSPRAPPVFLHSPGLSYLGYCRPRGLRPGRCGGFLSSFLRKRGGGIPLPRNPHSFGELNFGGLKGARATGPESPCGTCPAPKNPSKPLVRQFSFKKQTTSRKCKLLMPSSKTPIFQKDNRTTTVPQPYLWYGCGTAVVRLRYG